MGPVLESLRFVTVTVKYVDCHTYLYTFGNIYSSTLHSGLVVSTDPLIVSVGLLREPLF